jgi:predicted RNase H-like HicB family nuclease
MSTTARRTKPRSRSKADVRRPFDPRVLARAREIAAGYQVVMWTEDGEYYGRGVELPSTMGDGATPDACMKATREALTVTVAYMLEQGEAPPPAASEEKRTEQINLRVSAEEKLRLETLARQHGFKGVADYLRATGLARAG